MYMYVQTGTGRGLNYSMGKSHKVSEKHLICKGILT